MNALAPQDGAQRRKANFFRDTAREPSSIVAAEHARDLTTGQEIHRGPSVVGETVSERDKLVLIEQHITAFATTLSAGSLSEGDKQNIRSRAMRGGSSTSAILASVMQASAVVRPTLQPQIVNYFSGATSTDAKEAAEALGFGGRTGAGSPGNFGARGGYFARGDYASVSSSSGSGSSSSYVSNPGSVSMINYAATPYSATGMTHSTFTYLRDELRNERFSGNNILHAGQDSRAHGFKPNDRPVVRDFAIIDRDDGARRAKTNSTYKKFEDSLKDDVEIQRLRREKEQAATPEARKAIEDQMRARTEIIANQSGMTGHIQAAPTAASKAAHTRNKDRFVERHTGLRAEYRAEQGLAPEVVANTSLDEIRADRKAGGLESEVRVQYDRTIQTGAARSDEALLAEGLAAFGLPQAPTSKSVKTADASAPTPSEPTQVATAPSSPATTETAQTDTTTKTEKPEPNKVAAAPPAATTTQLPPVKVVAAPAPKGPSSV